MSADDVIKAHVKAVKEGRCVFPARMLIRYTDIRLSRIDRPVALEQHRCVDKLCKIICFSVVDMIQIRKHKLPEYISHDFCFFTA